MSKKVLVTGGSTKAMIDQVRAVTNIFSGQTAAHIAQYFHEHGSTVTLITSNPLIASDYDGGLIEYQTYDDLYALIKEEISKGNYDAVIHSAAVNDYKCIAVCHQNNDGELVELDHSGKIPSSYETLYLKMVKTEKIIDRIREWGFKGTLIKFKLQVDMNDDALLEIARKSRIQSHADIIVANCLEWAKERAYIIDDKDEISVERAELAQKLYEKVYKNEH